ncbi:tyrosine-protein kinase HTK16-like [Actinia tenebrosa]|uniref:Tyrosine-protein kinase n=1 Tax=Actinia tenebrosa TaxID=6105 RepID=A0A6P8IPD1_ACTTE|nr:tyrosine-protein kinase HTK16-like [Actinia tenebrosa]
MNIRDDASWYHGSLSREEALNTLIKHGKREGLFLVRKSHTVPGDYVLSLWNCNQALHFQIQCRGDIYFSIDDGPVFHGLDSLIEYYRENADGLPIRLVQNCAGSPPPASARKHGIQTRLHQACMDRNEVLVRRLLRENPLDVNARNENGRTPLHLAALVGDDEIVFLLLQCNADPRCRDNNGHTVLMCACIANHPSTCKILVQQGRANIQDRCTNTGCVALHEAASRGYTDCCQTLIELGAPLHPRTAEGDTPRDLALRHGYVQIADMIDNYPLPPPKTSACLWLHEHLDRKGSLDLFQKWGMKDGQFIIRLSTRDHGYYVLSLVLSKLVYHYQIKSRSDRWFYIDDGPLFETLPHVIDHYSKYADGLPVLLQFSIPPDGKPPVSLALRPPLQRSSSVENVIDSMPSRQNVTESKSRLGRSSSQGYPQPPQDVLPLPIPPLSNPLPRPPVTSDRRFPPRLPPGSQPQPPPDSTASEDKSPMPTQHTLINREDLELGSELGQGEFGSVLRGVWKDPKGKKTPVALKTLHPEKIAHGEQEFLREARVMYGLNHPCIVSLIGVCLGPPLILVQELVAMGALLDYLIDHQSEITPRDLKLWAAQIAWGMMYLEKKRFVHRDLATRNILMSSKHQLKISDFGLSRAVGSGSDYYKASQGGRWPVKWYAPESINYGTFSHKSDVWSYGVTLWEMYSFGQLPYGEMTGGEVIKLLENEGKRLERPDACPEHVYKLMLRCWDLKPERRPTFEELHNTFSTDPLYADVRVARGKPS